MYGYLLGLKKINMELYQAFQSIERKRNHWLDG